MSPRAVGLSANLAAFLDTIAVSELTREVLMESDDGYNVLVGSYPGNVKTFPDYSRHPHIEVEVRPGLVSSAAGRYQIIGRYADDYIKQLKLPDFGPESQDKIAIQMIGECHALDDVEAGAIEDAVLACSSRWASLPGAQYGQHVNKMDELLASYTQSGGSTVA